LKKLNGSSVEAKDHLNDLRKMKYEELRTLTLMKFFKDCDKLITAYKENVINQVNIKFI